jgi:hypothetical protein
MLSRAVLTAFLATSIAVTPQTAATANAAASTSEPGPGWGSVACSQDPSPGCTLGAGSTGTPTDPGSASPSSPTGDGNAGAGPASAQDTNPVQCTYVRSDFQAPPPTTGGVIPADAEAHPLNAADSTAPASPTPGGAWYVYQCSGNGQRDAVFRDPIWIPDAAATVGPAAPSAAALATQAENNLRLAPPLIHFSPTGQQLVNLPTWLWLDPQTWTAQSATATVPGISVTATATPTFVTWSMGDGNIVTCTGPGTAYAPSANPSSRSPSCGYTYRRASSGQPDSTFTVTATVHWSVTWAGNGQGGTFADLATTTAAGVPVTESQALNTH